MAKARAKRFYTDVTVATGGGGYVVQLDGRTLKTPGKIALVLERKDHADLIAAEWDAQKDFIDPQTMPCTRLANVATERTTENREAVIAEARKYGTTDLLCYRDPGMTALSRHQGQHWDPLLAWGKSQGIALVATDSVIAIPQDTASLDAIADYARGLSDSDLTLCVHFISTFGSAILGMALMQGHVSAQDAYRLSRLDELWQMTHWGEDADAAKRAALIESEILALAKMI